MSEPLSTAFPSAEELGNSLLQYDIQEQIQVETESAVYRARQPALDRQVMIRILAEPGVDTAASLMERLRSRARLVHPRIVAVYDFGRTIVGHLYLITEHVDGRLLCDLIRERQITPKLAYTLALQLCDALAMIHDNHTIHGALNTQTLLVDREWQIKLTGIGMAANETGELSWLHEAQASIIDDLYALGAVLHEMFGKEPLAQDGRVSRNLPPTFAAVIRRCVHPETERRFTDAAQVKEALINALRSEKQNATPAAAASPAPLPQAVPIVAPVSAPAISAPPEQPFNAPPRYAPGRPPPPVQRAQPSFGKRLDDFLWSCLRASLHLLIFGVAAGILFVSYLLKDKIVIGDKDSAVEEPAIPAEILGKLPEAPMLPETGSAPISKPIPLPKQDALASLNSEYQTSVQNEASAALEKVRLDELPFIQKELQRIQKGEPLPETDEADLPASLKQLRDDYRRKRAAIGR
ncbi:MAG: protein kinase [Verrucomicrobia bacterium]|nr:protein kinase [Verrucomicrobiota bacterium]